ncbi:nicotinate-nucleotide adenylyltransferase [Paenibacillus septentrionalis]|uniref:Probable nicotinate-nucleotide adenylyltransferase n=1 Tax=Paenibacillus septentrionalis TaxID=429342 RepID=A0ABW1UYA3_9BACL
MRKVGIMGGTFDPIHYAHLIAAQSAMEFAALDEVWFIPTSSPPLKPNAPLATEEQRLAMVNLAIQGEPRFRGLDIELNRGGTSYSIDTIMELRAMYPMHQFHYIIGSDRIHDLPRWHRAQELIQLVGFIGLNRPSEPLELDQLPTQWQSKLTIAPMPLIEISSTELRKRVKAGKALRYYVPDEVESYIRRHRLYE